ncbi:uncharacterized protein LOC127242872 [Andrographis paniculata]|uniref:uncharacterized protein LOC127242872 n=1 Tax=Andrographis paniculata TaxID=175694 RepID=UPI0021E96C72|nr:uncharacterized protein LOC127242872 [Andrographis paniculata]
MATSSLPLLLLLVAAAAATTAAARPCKTLFYFSATTTTTFYPNANSLPEDVNPNYIFRDLSPRYLNLVFTSATDNRVPDRFASINFDSNGDDSQSSSMIASSGLPLKFYSSVSSSIRDRTRDLMSVVGALLFGVGCGALTAAVMYLVWALFSDRRLEYEDVSSSDDEDDEISAAKKKFGYVAIPADAKVVEDEIKKPAAPAKEMV